MNIEKITPLILTFNEASNIARTLSRLTWAKSILIVDSYSTDDTLRIAREFPNTVILQRTFDHFADQCNFGLRNITTPWTLSLDADYLCPSGLPQELAKLSENCDGYSAAFRYCVYGKPLRATLYPPRTVLYQTSRASYVRDGHAHHVVITGEIQKLSSVIDHDDHKSLKRWLGSQSNYASLEADKLLGTEPEKLGWKDKLRRKVAIAPALTLFYCLFGKGLLLDGLPGFYYTLQRVYAELLLSLELLDRWLLPRQDPDRVMETSASRDGATSVFKSE